MCKLGVALGNILFTINEVKMLEILV